jgi:hypothetical protein
MRRILDALLVPLDLALIAVAFLLLYIPAHILGVSREI